METIPLFWQDSYLRECAARVTRTDGSRVYLDRTILFYGGGGQVADTGTIAGLPAAGARDESGEPCHLVDGGSFSVGQEVKIVLDWEKRSRIMRLHSAAHILYFVLKEFDPKLTASSGEVDDRKERSDILFSQEFDFQQLLPKVNARVAEIVAMGRQITVAEEARAGFEVNPWTGAPESGKEAGARRVWRLEGLFSEMECGGTHVKNSGEIGAVKISKGKSPGKGRKRIEIELA